LTFIDDGIKQAVLSPFSVTGKIRLMGFNITSVSTILIIALLKTSLSIIFGFVHLLLFWLLIKAAFIPLIIIFIFFSLAGWSIGYINEKYANGSIIPGWVAHGLENTISYFIIAFILKHPEDYK
jgi:uncharacterized protein